MVRRAVQVSLAGHPKVYLRALSLLGRGSPEKRVYLALVRRGDIVFDVGANLGYFTLLFSDIVGASGQVHAFEPVPPTFEALSAAVAEYQYHENIVLTAAACSDCDGTATMLVPGGDFGQASLRRHAHGSWRDEPAVHEYATVHIRLDQYFDAHAIRRVDFVKCDVEGAEWLVLKGMTYALRRHQPLLMIECDSDWSATFGYGAETLMDFLRSLGYDGFRWVTEEMNQPASRDALASGSGNLLCSVNDVHSDRLRCLELL